MLMCCFDEKRWEKVPESQREGIMREYDELVQNLVNSGHYLAGAKLQSSLTATTVLGKNTGANVGPVNRFNGLAKLRRALS